VLSGATGPFRRLTTMLLMRRQTFERLQLAGRGNVLGAQD